MRYANTRFCENTDEIIFDGVGKYDIPPIEPERFVPCEFIGFNYLKTAKDRAEKAVRLQIDVEDHTLNRTLTRQVWVTKSYLSQDGRPGEWITDQKAQEFYTSHRSKSEYTATWKDAAGKSFSAGKTAREALSAKSRQSAFDAGRKSYNELIEYAKSKGIKGVRRGMRRSTIEKKINSSRGK